MSSKNKNGKSYGTGRTRNYATVIYPESAPENWQAIFSEFCVPAFCSPLHDKDKNPTGEPKKAHWHLMLMFDAVKTPEQAKELFDSVGGVGCEKVISSRGYARYLCHLDNPEKHQYNIEDIRMFAGADYQSTIGLATDKYKAISEMIEFCEDHCMYSYSTLLLYCKENRFDWFRVLCDNGTMVMKEFLKAKFWTDNQ